MKHPNFSQSFMKILRGSASSFNFCKFVKKNRQPLTIHKMIF